MYKYKMLSCVINDGKVFLKNEKNNNKKDD